MDWERTSTYSDVHQRAPSVSNAHVTHLLHFFSSILVTQLTPKVNCYDQKMIDSVSEDG